MAELPLLVDDGNQSYLHGAGPLAQIDAAGTRYDLLADGLGSVRNLIDGSGAVVGAADYSMFGEYRNQTGVTSRFGFTGEYYAQETGMWHLRARDLHPGLGRFLSADPVQPNAPGTQGYNRYAYVANNPTTWVDPSGYTVEDPSPEDLALLAGSAAMLGPMAGLTNGITSPFLYISLIFRCGVMDGCLDLYGEMNALIAALGSMGLNTYVYTADALQNIFSTYPHQPTPIDPGLLVLSIGLSNTPILGDLYDLYTGVTGYDPITGQYLAGWERLANIVGALPILGLSGANIRHGAHAAESLIDNGDELGQFIGAAGKCRRNSFSEETPVATDEGAVPIGEIDVGDRVLAWDEVSDTAGYYIVSAAFSHVDATIIELTIDGETLETTADHPFYVVDGVPWLAVSETQGRWVEAGDLQVGDAVQKANGATGIVANVKVVAQPQRMYNLTVADAHTFFVGDGEWLVHNARICNWLGGGLTSDKVGNQLVQDAQSIFYQLPSHLRKTVIAVAQGGNEKIVTAFIKTDPAALTIVDQLSHTIGARYVPPWEIPSIWGSGHAEQIAYRELRKYSDLKIGITHGDGPCFKYCRPFFTREQFVNVFYP